MQILIPLLFEAGKRKRYVKITDDLSEEMKVNFAAIWNLTIGEGYNLEATSYLLEKYLNLNFNHREIWRIYKYLDSENKYNLKDPIEGQPLFTLDDIREEDIAFAEFYSLCQEAGDTTSDILRVLKSSGGITMTPRQLHGKVKVLRKFFAPIDSRFNLKPLDKNYGFYLKTHRKPLDDFEQKVFDAWKEVYDIKGGKKDVIRKLGLENRLDTRSLNRVVSRIRKKGYGLPPLKNLTGIYGKIVKDALKNLQQTSKPVNSTRGRPRLIPVEVFLEIWNASANATNAVENLNRWLKKNGKEPRSYDALVNQASTLRNKGEPLKDFKSLPRAQKGTLKDALKGTEEEKLSSILSALREEGSIAAAAEKLGVAPTVIRQILQSLRKLEHFENLRADQEGRGPYIQLPHEFSLNNYSRGQKSKFKNIDTTLLYKVWLFLVEKSREPNVNIPVEYFRQALEKVFPGFEGSEISKYVSYLRQRKIDGFEDLPKFKPGVTGYDITSSKANKDGTSQTEEALIEIDDFIEKLVVNNDKVSDEDEDKVYNYLARVSRKDALSAALRRIKNKN